MRPSDFAADHHIDGTMRNSSNRPHDQRRIIHSVAGTNRLHSSESWVEVASQPSSSSMSSVADDVATSPRGQADPLARRRRRLHRPLHLPGSNRLSMQAHGDGSGQEEHDESESESDHVMTSSTEELRPGFQRQDDSPPAGPLFHSDDTASDDENATALGVTSHAPVFTPQPDAFSHPPAARASHASAPLGSYFPSSQPTSSSAPTAPIRPPLRARSHTPYTMLAPASTVDHDAALRASLSTLLSCAAAARGLPKREHTSTRTHTHAQLSSRIEPSSLRLVPESALQATATASPPLRRNVSSASSSASPASPSHTKRKSASRDRREARKKRRDVSSSSTTTSVAGSYAIDELIVSPTLMTWVVSAGVVVLFGAISFSAGYAYGRELGRIEGAASAGAEAACAREAVAGVSGAGLGLGRFRWGHGSAVTV